MPGLPEGTAALRLSSPNGGLRRAALATSGGGSGAGQIRTDSGCGAVQAGAGRAADEAPVGRGAQIP